MDQIYMNTAACTYMSPNLNYYSAEQEAIYRFFWYSRTMELGFEENVMVHLFDLSYYETVDLGDK